MSMLQDVLAPHKNLILLFSLLSIVTTSLLLAALFRLAQILPNPTSTFASQFPARPPPSHEYSTRLLVVLGSGGHTAEMLDMLSTIPHLSSRFSQRTYIVSSGDSFSARKAVDFEWNHVFSTRRQSTDQRVPTAYSVVTVRRARRVHQSWLTTPFTTLLSLWDCITVLTGSHPEISKNKSGAAHVYPDLILTNGPGTGVCVVVAALLLRFFGYHGPQPASTIPVTPGQPRLFEEELYKGQGQMRTIFIESWARVKTLSLSGKILRPLVNRFLVQWPQLAEILGEGVEYIGPLVT